MDPVTIARWQFGITTVYHFLFVPLTIGLAPLIAGLETAWLRTGNLAYLRAAKFWGKLFLINFAIGVVTGLVQEFQFGMNWSDYSRFVGDVFGAPLAMEGILAFFAESTFLGLWIFGWDRLPPKLHAACMWVVSLGTLASAYFILAANSWMQHPVGYAVGADGKARLTDIWAVLGNSTQLVTFPHVLAASMLTGGVVMIAASAWQLSRGRHLEVFRPSLRIGLVTTLVAGVFSVISGDQQARVMTAQQPMKMAAAEALYQSAQPASFSLFTVGSLDGRQELFSLRLPRLLSFLATGSFNGGVDGVDNLQAEYAQRFGAGNYVPYVPITYWGFRLMIGFGLVAMLVAAAGLWATRSGRLPRSRWFWRVGVLAVALPFLANSFGWIFTEMGRQPWTVFGLLRTADSVSPTVGATQMLISLVVLTVLYGVLAVIDLRLMAKYAVAGPPTEDEVNPPADADEDRPLTFAY